MFDLVHPTEEARISIMLAMLFLIVIYILILSIGEAP